MKLGEALIKRDEYIKRLENLKERAKNNVRVQENDEPDENAHYLIKDYIKTNNELHDITKKINIKNHESILDTGISMAEALSIRDKLLRDMQIYKDILQEVYNKDYRTSKNEIKMTTLVNVKDIQKEIDKLSKAYSEIDIMIQSANWNIEL
ncbi:DIP1984 family protein [Brachyspira alvinipulli]|uniref:DIP1984 family protein n=1 Tax=Brachyspira alvinipulli TaxID=84379 RepID=UPI0004809346|nr:DIP1984 family protein [Brachyspira alvinipulli]